MINSPEQFFVERDDPVDAIQSSHAEILRSTNYSNEQMYTVEQLRAVAEYWEEETSNPLRSERSQLVARNIVQRATLECAYRNGTIDVLIDFYKQKNEELVA